MEVTRITKNNIEAFQDLFPEDFVFQEDVLAFGTVSDKREGVACMLLSLHDRERVFIDWLYTHPDRREMGAASELLNTVTAFLQGMSVREVCITFPEEDGLLEFFLRDRGFLVGEVSDVYEIPIEELMYTEESEKLLSRVKNPLPLWSLENEGVYADLCELLEGRGIQRDAFAEASKEFSLAEVDESGRVTGCILVKDSGDEKLEIMYLLNDEERRPGAMELLAGFYRLLEEKSLLDRKLVFADPGGHSISLMEKLTGGDREDFRVRGLMQGVRVL